MGLNTEERQDVVYFTGYEVEHTVAYGLYTLFVVGTPPLEEILAWAEQCNVDHIYFGTSQSFNPVTNEDWKQWNTCIQGCLEAGYWVALDFDVRYAAEIHEDGWTEHQKFIPMISVKLPYIKQLGYNATLKLDDKDFRATNPGVWCHNIHDLQDRSVFTDWSKYTKDETL